MFFHSEPKGILKLFLSVATNILLGLGKQELNSTSLLITQTHAHVHAFTHTHTHTYTHTNTHTSIRSCKFAFQLKNNEVETTTSTKLWGFET